MLICNITAIVVGVAVSSADGQAGIKNESEAMTHAAAVPVAHNAGLGTGDEAEEIEEIEELDVAPPVDTPATGNDFVRLLGRLHAPVVHFPLAWLVLVGLLDALAFLAGRTELAKAGLWVLGGAVLSFLPAMASGLLRLSELSASGAQSEGATVHRNVMIAVFLLSTLALALRLKLPVGVQRNATIIYGVVLLLAIALVSVGGHLGGTLVYGENFLGF